MTKNNLTEHLSWLLSSASRGSDLSGSIRPFERAELWKSVAGSSSEFSQREVFVPPVSTSGNPLVTSSNGTEQFARPNLSASALRALAKDDMAKLQSGPRSSYKPRLLSELAVVSPQTTAPHVSHHNSLSAQYSRGLDGK